MTETITKRILGHSWQPYKQGWATQIEQRYSVLVSPTGSTFIVRIAVDYAHAPGGAVGVLILGQHTEREAMQAGIDWIDRHLSAGSPGADEVLKECYVTARTFIRTRLDALDYLFCTIGNGYDWLDGSIVLTTIENASDAQAWKSGVVENIKRQYLEALPELREQLKASFDQILQDQQEIPVGPVPDDGSPHAFYPLSDFSALLKIPPDIKPDWLALAHETAIALRDRSAEDTGQEDRARRNREAGARIAGALKARYPQLAP
jgi:hypothetical protein